MIAGGKIVGGYTAGGGIYCENSNPTIDCNYAQHEPGRQRDLPTTAATISDCTIKTTRPRRGSAKTATPPSATASPRAIRPTITAAGLQGQRNPTISGCTIKDNTYNTRRRDLRKDSNPTISGCTFTNNFPTTIVCDFNMSETASTTGACCVSLVAMFGMGGTWLGEDSSCDDSTGCAGDTDNDGTVGIEDLLIVIEMGFCP